MADGEFYRVFPNGEVQYLYPSQGTPSERVNAGRTAANVISYDAPRTVKVGVSFRR